MWDYIRQTGTSHDYALAGAAMSRMLNLLRAHPPLRWFGLGLLVSRIGDAFNSVALAWLALTIGDPQDLALVLVCAGLPRMVMSPLAGRAFDRSEPRTLLIADNSARAAIIAAIPVLGWLHLLCVWQLCLIAAMAGAVSALSDVGENLVAPALVPDAQLEAASGLLSLSYEVSALAGPAAAGVLVSMLGYEAAFVCDAGSFLVMAAAAAVLPSLRQQPIVGGHAGLGLAAGFRALVSMRLVAAMTAVCAAFTLLSGINEVIWPAYSKYALRTSASGFGILMTVAGFGATAGVLTLSERLSRYRLRTSLSAVLGGYGLLFIPLALTASYRLALFWTFLVYFAGMSFFAIDRAVVQRAASQSPLGQVFGARQAILAGAMPLGAAIAGPLVADFGPKAMFAVVGVVLIGLSLMARLLPVFGISSRSGN